jgi:hypothetical protein
LGTALLLLGCFGAERPDVDDHQDAYDDTGEENTVLCEDATAQTQELFEEHCVACHGNDGSDLGGFGVIEDVNALISSDKRYVVPGYPEESYLYQRVEDGDMPPGNEPFSDRQVDVLHSWISCGAEDFSGEAERPFLSLDDEMARIEEDLRALGDEELAENARYLRLTHLYNAGEPSERLQFYERALNKVVNSLSPEAPAARLIPVDLSDLGVESSLASSVLFRLQLDDFGWDTVTVDKWELLVAEYPYGNPYLSDDATDVETITGSRLAVLNGDWIAANATRGDLYVDMLELPGDLDSFLSLFMASTLDEDFDSGNVDCAGFQESGVSNNNRVICHHQAQFGYCWVSYDFASSLEEKNILQNPTGFRENADGGEAFCSLRNGQHAYYIADSTGAYIDTAPVEIVFDHNADAAVIENGLSCMRCHQGVIPKSDEVLEAVTTYSGIFSEEEQALVEDWFPPNDELNLIYDEDQALFTDAGLAIGQKEEEETEPVYALAEEHLEPMNSDRVAAEMGLSVEQLETLIYYDKNLGIHLSPLLYGNTVTRASFDQVMSIMVCTTAVGGCEDDGCGTSGISCLDEQICQDDGTCAE